MTPTAKGQRFCRVHGNRIPKRPLLLGIFCFTTLAYVVSMQNLCYATAPQGSGWWCRIYVEYIQLTSEKDVAVSSFNKADGGREVEKIEETFFGHRV